MAFFKQFVQAFHAADAYRAMREIANFGMAYAFKLVALTSLFVVVFYGQFLYRGFFASQGGAPALFDSVVTQIAEQLPVMTLKNHSLMTKEPVATEIKITGNAFGTRFDNLLIAVIDTTGQSTHSNMRAPVLVTATEFIVNPIRKPRSSRSAISLTMDRQPWSSTGPLRMIWPNG